MHISEDTDLSNVKWHLEIDKTQLRWESYVKAGYYGVLERFFTPPSSLNDEQVTRSCLQNATD